MGMAPLFGLPGLLMGKPHGLASPASALFGLGAGAASKALGLDKKKTVSTPLGSSQAGDAPNSKTLLG